MLLRRGLLVQYKTLDELFAGRHINITIDPHRLDKPVLLKSGPRGLRATKAGFPANATIYAWRRKAGTTVDEAVGRDKARLFLYHTNDSTIFERFYDQGIYALDIRAIAYGEDYIAGVSAMALNSLPVLYRATVRFTVEEENKIVNNYINQHLPLPGPGIDIDLERRRLRRHTRKEMYAEA
ncbi:hypothetical protein EJ08DRAFT_703590 [Tothia fuscella]|uniref:Uncharacterized protein n=1 Tax=Tothia fuscella TaxID=1048955 RepID=A0A9P4TRH2_9PEZI|nr:hypothetical protein EJ08DRAFT_703590 [Tothia fuscella]